MSKRTFPMTKKGLNNLRRELRELEGEKSIKATERIKYARSFCDFQEDSEYEAAVKERANIDARISKLKQMIQHATVIERSDHHSVTIGATVEIKVIDTKEIETFTIVGPEKIDPYHGRISYNSPIAKQLLNKKVGDEVVLKTPSGGRKIEVVKIR